MGSVCLLGSRRSPLLENWLSLDVPQALNFLQLLSPTPQMNLSSLLVPFGCFCFRDPQLTKPDCSTDLAKQPCLCSLGQTLGPGVLPLGIFQN